MCAEHTIGGGGGGGGVGGVEPIYQHQYI